MKKLEVLISGAGIAGCTLAYWLTHNGHSVTVVERSSSLRSSGSPVDVRGPAVDVVERMKIAALLREASIRVKGINILDERGQRIARVDTASLRSSIAPKDMEIARGDLARILHEASNNDTNYIFGDYIKALIQDEKGVDVAFERSPPRRFDLVIGADGLHSIVRRMAFGADSEFAQHAGLYAATVSLPRSSSGDGEIFMLNTPGKLVALHPCQNLPLACFIFWHPEIPEFDYTDQSQRKQILKRIFTNIGWRVQEFLEAANAADDMYFDSVARVDVPKWARGRIALLGDASSCVSLFGDGSTLAIVGAYELAKALTESPEDPQTAFSRYQAVHGKLVASKQKNLILMASLIVPRTPIKIWLSKHVLWKTISGLSATLRLGQKLREK